MPPSTEPRLAHPRPPGGVERIVGALVLLGLSLFGGWLLRQQTRTSPAVLALSATSSVERPASAEPPSESLKLSQLGGALVPFGEPERFNATTLSDKINGRADLYLREGFRSLSCQRFQVSGAPERWSELCVYDMGDPKNALRVASAQRRPGLESLSIGQGASASEAALFFRHGPFYAEIISSDTSVELRDARLLMARSFIQGTPTQDTALAAPPFPLTGLDEGSLSHIADDAFGCAQLDELYTSRYRREGVDLVAFLSRKSSAEEASRVSAEYVRFLVSLGGTELPLGELGARVELLGTSTFVLAVGAWVAGVQEASDPQAALSLLRELHEGLIGERP